MKLYNLFYDENIYQGRQLPIMNWQNRTETKPLVASCLDFFYLSHTKGLSLPSPVVYKISDIWWLYAVI